MEGERGVFRLGFCGEEMKNFCCFGRENEEDEGIGVVCMFK